MQKLIEIFSCRLLRVIFHSPPPASFPQFLLNALNRPENRPRQAHKKLKKKEVKITTGYHRK